MKLTKPITPIKRRSLAAANGTALQVPETSSEVRVPTELERAISEGNTILDGAKGKFPIVMVIGLTEGNQLDITTNSPQYPTLQWILNRASFELLLHEKQSLTPVKPDASNVN